MGFFYLFPTLNQPAGHIEIICGCMFSGKTEELISRINLAISDGDSVAVFKPKLDIRYDLEEIVSHNNTRFSAKALDLSNDILKMSEDADVIAIDEAQFFDSEIVLVANTLANLGKRVIIAGLDMDFRGNPFGSMPQLLAVAEHVTKLKAKCAISGEDASFSFRLNKENETVVLGAAEKYQPRNRKYFFATNT